MKNLSISLAYNDQSQGGTSDKVYFLSLSREEKGFAVTAQYGRRGSTLATDCKTKNGPVSYEEAKTIFDRVTREKIAKGYRSTDQSTPAPQVASHKTTRAPRALAAIEIRAQELLTEISEREALALVASPDYLMQDKSDGHSRGVVKSGGEIFGLNKLGKRVPLPADLARDLARIELDSFQLDAELIGNRWLVARDILNDGRELAALPYEKRFVRLVEVLTVAGTKLVSCVTTWEGAQNKAAALALQRKEHREGVVFKLRHASHRAGRNGQHKKFKFVKTLSAIAGKPRATGKASVELFLHRGKELVNVGTVSLIGKETIEEGAVLEIAYLYAFRGSDRLIQARLLRKREDVAANECTASQLIYKREDGQ